MSKNDVNLSLNHFINKDNSQNISYKNNNSSVFTILCWNINNPSLERARKQSQWIRNQNADVIVLTECKNSEGCRFLETCFRSFGYYVSYTHPEENEYGTMIISKAPLIRTDFSDSIGKLRVRVVSVSVNIFDYKTEIIGVYVPSRDVSFKKIERKKNFINNMLEALNRESIYSNRIFCGDFNVLEPTHVPHYSIFENWEYNFYNSLCKYKFQDAFRHLNPTLQEYSWMGRTGDGYRYDHFFVTNELLPLVKRCDYIHEPRSIKLSDHSALICILEHPHR